MRSTARPMMSTRPGGWARSGPTAGRTPRASEASGTRGTLYFTSSPHARKARNLAENRSATIAVRLDGIDVVFEGDVERVTDHATLETVAKLGREGGWPAEVEGDALTAPFSAPSAGPPPWNVYRLTFDTVFGVATDEPYGASRWRFAE